MSIPHLFRCPISLDLFTDPVTLSTGQTYDRPSIEKWLASGNSTCPVTMQRLRDTSLVPNHTLRHLIDRWLISGPQPNYNSARPTGTGTTLPLTSLKQNLQSPETGIAAKREIIKKIKILSSESDIGQSCLIQSGFFQYLLQMLFHTLLDQELVELVLDCVLNLLPSTQLESLDLIKKEANLAPFQLLITQGSIKIKTGLCAILGQNRGLCAIVGQNQLVLRVIVSLIHSRDVKASEAAASAISGICSIEANRVGAVKEGAVDGFVSYLMHSTQRKRNELTVLATLEILAELQTGKKALIRNSDAVEVLVKYVFRVKDNEGSESAVGVLLILCRESGKARSEAVSAGVLTQVLLLLQSQCGTKGKAKGRALLKVLGSM